MQSQGVGGGEHSILGLSWRGIVPGEVAPGSTSEQPWRLGGWGGDGVLGDSPGLGGSPLRPQIPVAGCGGLVCRRWPASRLARGCSHSAV